MKFRFIVEGDYFEDFTEIKEIAHMRDLSSANWEARQTIRSRMKYSENVSDEEYKFLEELRNILYVEGLE